MAQLWSATHHGRTARRGWTVNPKRVYRLLREDNLLCLRKRKFVVTTDSNHGRKIYPNLAGAMVLINVDQLWRADIMYIRLREEFVFLAVILDAYSRRVIGWALGRTLEDELMLTALRMLCRAGIFIRVWCITPIAAASTPATTTRTCSMRIRSTSACRARQIVGQRGLRVIHENAEV
ncbi:MAG: DDE-type integrase/transposase/recombinase [Candidatus Korobacteraceae bacterium]